MLGKRIPIALCLMLLGGILIRPSTVRAQEQDAKPSIRVRPSLGIEYFSRTLDWDEGLYSSKIKAAVGVLRAEIELQKDFNLGLFAGFDFSNFNGLVFRQLPFSVDYEAGSIGSFLWGVDVDKILLSIGDYEIGAMAQFVMALGRTKDFEIPSLNQTGTLSGKGRWNRLLAGPVVRYKGYEDFTPFVAVTYNKLSGTFMMTETIQDLEGTEEKEIKSRGFFGITVGTVYQPVDSFQLKADITALPYSKIAGGLDVDYSVSVRAVFSF